MTQTVGEQQLWRAFEELSKRVKFVESVIGATLYDEILSVLNRQFDYGFYRDHCPLVARAIEKLVKDRFNGNNHVA